MPQSVRSVLAVLAGFFAMVAVVILFTLATVKAMHLQSGHPTPLYLTLNVVYSLGAAVLGGWLTGRIAGRARVAHGVALALLMVFFGAMGMAHPAPGQSLGYLVFLVIGPAVAAVGGAWLASR